jgi:hypothetical protein
MPELNGPVPDPNVTRIVVTVHGIRTFGQWQERFGALLRRQGFTGRIVHFKYGYFSSVAFLVPPLRSVLVRRFRLYLGMLRVNSPNASSAPR